MSWPPDLGTLYTPPKPRFHPNAIQTFTGLAYDFEAPTAEMIELDDIAHALSNACRFAGHVRRFYSVAEHCVRVSYAMEAWYPTNPLLWRDGLMHDGHEAYVWDCPRPFKPLFVNAEGVNIYERFADNADAAIGARFGIDPSRLHSPQVKRADDCLLVAEARLLMTHGPEEWASWDSRYSEVPPPPLTAWPPEGYNDAVGWPPHLAEDAFHHRAKEVGLCAS
jgi:hypothetical protein